MPVSNIIPLDAFYKNSPRQAGTPLSASSGTNDQQSQNDRLGRLPYRQHSRNDRLKQLPYRPVFIFDASLARESSKEQLVKQANAALQTLHIGQRDDSPEQPLIFVTQRPENISTAAKTAPTIVQPSVQPIMRPGPSLRDDLTSQYKSLLAAVESNNVSGTKQCLRRGINLRRSEENLSRLLHIAAKKGYREILNLLLRNSAPVDGKDKDQDTPLLIAAREGHKDIVSTLLLFEADVRATNVLKRTALHEACGAGHIDVVELLLMQKGAKADPLDDKGESPLHLAVIKERSAVVDMLLRYRAVTDRAYENGSYVLHVAARQGFAAILKSLLDAGAALKPPGQTPSPLYLAISHKQTEAVRALLQHGALVTEVDDKMETALHVATRAGHDAAIDLLLEKGCLPNSKNASNETALHMAVLDGSVETAMLLLGTEEMMAANKAQDDAIIEAVKSENPGYLALFLSRGANVNQVNSSNQSLLHVAIEAKRQGSAALLLVHGAALDTLNTNRQTPLMSAITQESLDMVRLLLAYDAKNINAACVGGHTPLVFGIKKNIPAVIDVIIKSGADIELTGEDGRTPLHVAIEMGCTVVAECLLKAGANPNARNIKGQTPLHRLVVGCAKEKLVHLLVNHGAKVEAKADDGSTPLFFAACNDKSAIVEALASHVATRDTGGDHKSSLAFVDAVVAGNAKTVRMYLEHGVSVHSTSADGYSVIGLAASEGHNEVIKVLLEKGANINTSFGSAETPLIRAVTNHHATTVELLLDRGADTEATSITGMRALHHACDGKIEDAPVVKLLLKSHAIVDARFIASRKSKTALHFAVFHGFYDTTKLLLDYGADPLAKKYNKRTALNVAGEFHKNSPNGRALIKLLASRRR